MPVPNHRALQAPKKGTKKARQKQQLPGQTSITAFFPKAKTGASQNRTLSSDGQNSADVKPGNPKSHKCSSDQETEPPTFAANHHSRPVHQPPHRETRPRWRMDLGVLFEEFARTDHPATGPQLPVDVWYIHHTRHPACLAPRLVILVTR